MDIATGAGLLAGIAVITTLILMGGDFRMFYDVHAVIIIFGGSLAATAHATKASARLLINASPEPFSNWTASIAEDVAVVGGLWTALYHPELFLALLLLFLVLVIWLLPKIWRGIRTVFAALRRRLGGPDATSGPPPAPQDARFRLSLGQGALPPRPE